MKKLMRKPVVILLTVSMSLPISLGMQCAQQEEEATVYTSEYWTNVEGLKEYRLEQEDDIVGKVIFGQNGSGESQMWNIAGTDTKIEGDNLILTADTSLGTSLVEEDTHNFKEYLTEWNCTYPEGTTVTEVNPNHYGGSALRSLLNSYVSEDNTDYFSASEKERMNKTTIYTEDTLNQVCYATTDTLYAAYASANYDKYITVGSNSETNLNDVVKIDIRNWGYPVYWLRTPDPDYMDGVLVADTDSFVGVRTSEIDYIEVVPACNLNVSSVLFASAAVVATSSESHILTVADANTFVLRYAPDKDSDLAKASVKISHAGDKVKIKNAKSGMYLVVQKENKAYCVAVDENTTSVAAVDISGSELTSLENCNVWLESTDTDRITSAVLATKAAH